MGSKLVKARIILKFLFCNCLNCSSLRGLLIYIIFLLVSFCYIFKILFFFKRNLYADILSTPAGFYNLTDYLSGLEGFICQPFTQKVTRICQ